MATAVKVLHGRDEAQVTNGGESAIDTGRPYQLHVVLRGVAPILLHGWNCDAVQEKAKAAKGSKAKKSDDLESYVYRDDSGNLALPGTYLYAALCDAARYQQDPRSPRKSLKDLARAAIIVTTTRAPFEPPRKTWDYEDQRRVTVQRNGVTRVRPALREGWQISFDMLITMPEYLPPDPQMQRLLADAGRLCGLGDFRPTYGRFGVVGFEVVQD